MAKTFNNGIFIFKLSFLKRMFNVPTSFLNFWKRMNVPSFVQVLIPFGYLVKYLRTKALFYG